MIKLLIDTASSRIILGLFQDEKILSEINEENDNQLSVRIFPLIDKLFGLFWSMSSLGNFIGATFDLCDGKYDGYFRIYVRG